jgi:NAD(P)-dependent dehydrogenase (short-subunit alcohol dehydrogenase family)
VAVDVLINNAGIMGPDDQDVSAMDYAAWMDTLAINVLAPFRVTTALVPNLVGSARPRVVTLTSIMGSLSRDSTGYYAYRSSKAAANKVMRLLARDLAAQRIVVCPVHPGWVQTEMGGPSSWLRKFESSPTVVPNRLVTKVRTVPNRLVTKVRNRPALTA